MKYKKEREECIPCSNESCPEYASAMEQNCARGINEPACSNCATYIPKKKEMEG